MNCPHCNHDETEHGKISGCFHTSLNDLTDKEEFYDCTLTCDQIEHNDPSI